MSQNDTITQARELLKPSPVKLHHIPDWFRKRLLAVYGPHNQSRSGRAVVDGVRQLYRDSLWLDHYGSTTYRGQTVFVSEPYCVTDKTLCTVAEIAKAIDVEWLLESNSWWYPGRTIRIMFYERPEVF